MAQSHCRKTGRRQNRMKLSRETCLHVFLLLGLGICIFRLYLPICIELLLRPGEHFLCSFSIYSLTYFEGGTNMQKTKLISIALSCLMLLTLVTGCTQSTGDKTAETTAAVQTASAETTAAPAEQTQTTAASVSGAITVTDMTGRKITLDAPAQKIVALTASDCEILYAIGAGDTLVGRGEYCDYPAEVSSVPSVQSGTDTNIEQIIALNPQVVIMSAMAQTEEQIASLEAAGITVVESDAIDIAGVYTAIELIGSVTGKNAEAAGVVDQMEATFDELSAKVTNKGDKTVYFEVSPLEYGLWTAGSGTFMDEIAAMLGLTNAFADVEGWGEISQEQVIERDPDYIVTVAMYFGEGVKPVDEIMGRDGWQNMKAIKNGGIFNADSNEISRPGPRLADAARSLYSFIYEKSAV